MTLSIADIQQAGTAAAERAKWHGKMATNAVPIADRYLTMDDEFLPPVVDPSLQETDGSTVFWTLAAFAVGCLGLGIVWSVT